MLQNHHTHICDWKLLKRCCEMPCDFLSIKNYKYYFWIWREGEKREQKSKGINFKPGTHQADTDELVAMKADCGVGSRLGPKLPWHTKPTLDTRRQSSTSILRLSRALVCQLNSQSEWSDGPTDRRASPCRIGRKKADEDQLQPTVRNTLRKLSRPTNKNFKDTDWWVCKSTINF